MVVRSFGNGSNEVCQQTIMPTPHSIPLIDSLRVLHSVRREDEIVITAMGTAREWMELGPLKPLDFVYVPSSMGQATSLGLGLALARPDVRVIVAGGDGGLLMNLGTLATITARGPSNLWVIVFDNGVYEVTGGQATPAAGAHRVGGDDVEFPAVAAACGFVRVHSFDKLQDWQHAARGVLDGTGPVYVHLKVAPLPGAVGPRSPSPAAKRAAAFAKALRATVCASRCDDGTAAQLDGTG